MLERVHQLIRHETSPPDGVIALLVNTLIGTNGTLYQLKDTATKIHQLHQPHFFFLERHGKVIGNVTVCEREVTINNQKASSFYLRYFAFDPIFQGSSEKGRANSHFHNYFKAFFSNSQLNPTIPSTGKSIFWAFIDPENLRSFNMNERFGFQTIREFRTWAFSRVRPKPYAVEALQKNDQQEVLEMIEAFYANHSFFSSTHLFTNGQYYVLRENGEIIAGIQANAVSWKIKSLPGWSGQFLLRTARFIPGIRKLINPENHQFLATEGLFWKPGYENMVEKLLEGVLSKTDHHSLLIWEDSESSCLADLNLSWGFIQQMKKDHFIHVVAKFNEYTEAEIETIKQQFVYLSGFDMT